MRQPSMLASRLKYYLASIPTLLRGFKNPLILLALLIPMKRRSLVVRLRNGLVFRVRTAMDAWVVKETCLDLDYEPPGYTIEKDWVIVDLGAGLGEFAVSAAKKAPDGFVYAYEPFSESFQLLQENVRLNGVINIAAHPFAVGASDRLLRLNMTTGVPVLYSTVENDRSTMDSGIMVQGTTLDEILSDQAVRHCDLLKIDCEGAEFDILFSASPETIRRVDRICLEYHDGETRFDHQDLVESLERNCFAVTVKPNPVHSHTGLLYARRQEQ